MIDGGNAVQVWRAFVALAEELGLIPSTHTMVHNQLSLNSRSTKQVCDAHTYMKKKHSYTQNKMN